MRAFSSNTRVRRAGVVLTALAIALVACATIGRAVIEKPKVGLDNVSVSGINGDGMTVVFGVSVENPNSFALKVDTLRYDVEIGGKPFSSGKIDKPAEVGGKARSVIDLPIPVRYADLFSSLGDLLRQHSSSYRIKGEASVGLMTIPFDEHGDFKLNDQ